MIETMDLDAELLHQKERLRDAQDAMDKARREYANAQRSLRQVSAMIALQRGEASLQGIPR